ncbi:MAG: DinB family protein [Armatimonadetes bacterium]|nr:DinB family protein [Armatimonadota bacterium]
MTTTHGLLKARLEMIRRQLDQVLDHFSDEDLAWSPAEGARTVGGQILEIADKDRESVRWLQTGVWPDDEPPSFDVQTASLSDMRGALRTIRQTTYEYIDSLTEAELETLHPSPEGWLEALGLTECPRSEIIRNIAAHEWYHVGQLLTYCWVRGDDPNLW